MVKLFKVTLIISVVCLVSILSLSCASESDSVALSENEVVTVERGNLIIDIAAVGNLALSRTEDLAFDLFYPEGTVEEVLVEEGDTVEEGQVLARVDTSEWQDELTTLERQLAAEERDLVQAEINLVNAEIALQDADAQYVWPEEIFAAREAVWAAESDVEEAQAILRGDQLIYDRNTGEYRYQEAITVWDIKLWTQNLSDAEEELRTAQAELDELLAESVAEAKVSDAEEKLRAAQAKLDKLLAESATDTEVDAEEIEIQRMKVELAQEQLEDAQKALEGVAVKRLQVELTQGKLEDAQIAFEDAQKELDEARNKSPLITATFDGFVIEVNVEGGDEIYTGTVAVAIADPNKFEADVMVSEMDILQVRLGGEATVQVDAMQGLSLPAEVTHISPTATIQSGVVNYKVKVELKSLTPLEPSAVSGKQEQPQTGLEAFNQRMDKAVEAGTITQERADEIKEGVAQGVGLEDSYQRLDEALEAGTITQEQAEQIRERLDQWKAALEQQPEPMPMQVPDEFQLREGLTVTVSIIVDDRNDVLLVPNAAITYRGGAAYVQVSKDGVIEERSITTGIGDWQYTEVASGLSEGEQVVVSQGTTTTTTEEGSSGGIMIPGMGRPR